MATNAKKRQRKLEKKSAKRKSKKHALIRSNSMPPSELLGQNPDSPILHCWRFESMFADGIGHVLLSRTLPGGKVAVAMFLVDVWCLGVKDALFHVVDKAIYTSRFGKRRFSNPIIDMDPSAARALVEDAVEYAQALGLPPSADYHKAKLIFGGIDANECNEEFVFGDDGEPHFFSGPNDTPARCRAIVETLRNICGDGNFHFTLAVGSTSKMNLIHGDDGYDGDDEGDIQYLGGQMDSAAS